MTAKRDVKNRCYIGGCMSEGNLQPRLGFEGSK